jgi:hypothetical protein
MAADRKAKRTIDERIAELQAKKLAQETASAEQEPAKAAYADRRNQLLALKAEMKTMRDSYKAKYGVSLEPRKVK